MVRTPARKDCVPCGDADADADAPARKHRLPYEYTCPTAEGETKNFSGFLRFLAVSVGSS